MNPQKAELYSMLDDPYDRGCITRRHFYAYRPGCDGAPPPLHVHSAHEDANWAPLPRPLPDSGMPGPALAGGGQVINLGIDPTDPSTWAGRGYNQSPGMCARFNAVTPGSPFGEGLAWAP